MRFFTTCTRSPPAMPSICLKIGMIRLAQQLSFIMPKHAEKKLSLKSKKGFTTMNEPKMSPQEYLEHVKVGGCLTEEGKQYVELRDALFAINLAMNK